MLFNHSLFQCSTAWHLWPYRRSRWLTDTLELALTLATNSLSLSAACRWVFWKLFRAAEKSFNRRSFCIFLCRYETHREKREATVLKTQKLNLTSLVWYLTMNKFFEEFSTWSGPTGSAANALISRSVSLASWLPCCCFCCLVTGDKKERQEGKNCFILFQTDWPDLTVRHTVYEERTWRPVKYNETLLTVKLLNSSDIGFKTNITISPIMSVFASVFVQFTMIHHLCKHTTQPP